MSNDDAPRGAEVVGRFRRRLGELSGLDAGSAGAYTFRQAVETDVIYAVGVLLGSGVPGAAAAVAMMAERLWPLREADGDWPWTEPEPEGQP